MIIYLINKLVFKEVCRYWFEDWKPGKSIDKQEINACCKHKVFFFKNASTVCLYFVYFLSKQAALKLTNSVSRWANFRVANRRERSHKVGIGSTIARNKENQVEIYNYNKGNAYIQENSLDL